MATALKGGKRRKGDFTQGCPLDFRERDLMPVPFNLTFPGVSGGIKRDTEFEPPSAILHPAQIGSACVGREAHAREKTTGKGVSWQPRATRTLGQLLPALLTLSLASSDFFQS